MPSGMKLSRIQFKDEDDAIIWKLEANGIYTVSSLYAVVNFRLVMPVDVHKVWSIKVPPKIHFFLWLLTHNKLLTRDNLSKRQHLDDASCIFCSEPETSTHVFFECVVAKVVWERICAFTSRTNTPVSHEFIARHGVVVRRTVLLILCMLLFFGLSGLPKMICILTELHGLVRRSYGGKQPVCSPSG